MWPNLGVLFGWASLEWLRDNSTQFSRLPKNRKTLNLKGFVASEPDFLKMV